MWILSLKPLDYYGIWQLIFTRFYNCFQNIIYRELQGGNAVYSAERKREITGEIFLNGRCCQSWTVPSKPHPTLQPENNEQKHWDGLQKHKERLFSLPFFIQSKRLICYCNISEIKLQDNCDVSKRSLSDVPPPSRDWCLHHLSWPQ